MNVVPISAIELEGFQCFEERTRLEFAPLTLFYGPNSAGKSAIFDAIELLKLFWDPFNRDEEKIKELVDRWARRSSESKKSQTRKLSIAVEFPFLATDVLEFSEEDVGTYRYALRSAYEKNQPNSFALTMIDQFEDENYSYDLNKQVRLEFEVNTIDTDSGALTSFTIDKLSIDFDGKHLIKVVSGANASPSYETGTSWEKHGRNAVCYIFDNGIANDLFELQCLEKWTVTKETSYSSNLEDIESFSPAFYFKRLPGEADSLCSYEFDDDSAEKVLDVDDYHFAQRFDASDQNSRVYSARILFLNNPTSFFANEVVLNLAYGSPVKDVLESVSKTINYFFIFFGSNLVNELIAEMPPVVTGNRSLPRTSELTQHVDLSIEYSQTSSDDQFDKFYYHLLLRSAYARQIKAVHDGTYEVESNFCDWSSMLPYGRAGDSHLMQDRRRRLQQEANLVERVNQLFSEHLFDTHLYQIDISSQVLIDFSPREPDPSNWLYGSYGAAIAGARANASLVVIDSNLNALSLSDVGSGIGYSLPFLVALSLDGVIGIQQPELHLHPSLQSKLGDLLLSRLTPNNAKQLFSFNQTIVETHSEHLLLRILKRIRQARGKNNPSNLDHKDIAIYYFDPVSKEVGALGQTTSVYKQEISPGGELMQPWPNGFFEERWDELSDD